MSDGIFIKSAVAGGLISAASLLPHLLGPTHEACDSWVGQLNQFGNMNASLKCTATDFVFDHHLAMLVIGLIVVAVSVAALMLPNDTQITHHDELDGFNAEQDSD